MPLWPDEIGLQLKNVRKFQYTCFILQSSVFNLFDTITSEKNLMHLK